MDIILYVALSVVIGAVGSLVAMQLAACEAKWTPRIVHFAASRLPRDLQARYEEEWLAQIDDTPGELARLTVALSLVIAAYRIVDATQFVIPLEIRMVQRICDIIIAAVLCILTLPVIVLATLAISAESRGHVFDRRTAYGPNGAKLAIFYFRIAGCDPEFEGQNRFDGVSYFLYRTRIYTLPIILSVFRGELSFVGPMCCSIRAPAYGPRDDGRTIKPGIFDPFVFGVANDVNRSEQITLALYFRCLVAAAKTSTCMEEAATIEMLLRREEIRLGLPRHVQS